MSTAGIEIVDRDAWLASRADGIGASEAAAAVGIHPYTTPVELYLRKLGLAPPKEETEEMRWGTWAEPMLAEEYFRRTAHRIERSQVFKAHDRHPEIFATLDGVDSAGDLVELKTINERAAKGRIGDEWTDELPEEWLCQAAQQMAVFGADRVLFGVKIWGQPFRIHEVRRDAGLAASVVEGVAKFWREHIQARVMPEVDYRDAAVLSRLRPSPGRTVALSPELDDAVRDYINHGVALKAIERERDLDKARILAAMGDAETAISTNGVTFTRKVIEVKERTTHYPASSYIRLYHKEPKS